MDANSISFPAKPNPASTLISTPSLTPAALYEATYTSLDPPVVDCQDILNSPSDFMAISGRVSCVVPPIVFTCSSATNCLVPELLNN